MINTSSVFDHFFKELFINLDENLMCNKYVNHVHAIHIKSITDTLILFRLKYRIDRAVVRPTYMYNLKHTQSRYYYMYRTNS